MAEIFFSTNEIEKELNMIEKAKKVGKGDFAIDSYKTQREKLNNLFKEFNTKYKI